MPLDPQGRLRTKSFVGADSMAASKARYSALHDSMRRRLQAAGYDATMDRVDGGKKHVGLAEYKRQKDQDKAREAVLAERAAELDATTRSVDAERAKAADVIIQATREADVIKDEARQWALQGMRDVRAHVQQATTAADADRAAAAHDRHEAAERLARLDALRREGETLLEQQQATRSPSDTELATLMADVPQRFIAHVNTQQNKDPSRPKDSFLRQFLRFACDQYERAHRAMALKPAFADWLAKTRQAVHAERQVEFRQMIDSDQQEQAALVGSVDWER
ncbi:MAG: hypothetical protein LBI33_00330 [Propionibacteriaceae bacterium]|nr:hypothetical protein [Propionibacteriaceae bacterium]